MTSSFIRKIGFALLFSSTLLALACHKKIDSLPPPPPQLASTTASTPPTPAPTITLRAEPSTIDRGGATTLQWEARNAATVTITPGVGDVMLTGSRSVNPASSVTYTASATGPGGTATDIARVTVNVPAPPAADTGSGRRPPDVSATPLDQLLQDISFDYDKADIRPDQVSVLQKNATTLKSNANARVTIEGHCDDRGSEEYNIGLGQSRANAVKEFLLSQGIPANRLNVVSYGEERPVCREETEQCFARNRRAHFAVTQ